MTDPLKLAAVLGRITVWHATLPDPKPTCFSCSELAAGTGLTMQQIHLPLTLLGWSRAEVWHRKNCKRYRRVYYAPPGHEVPRPPRGRPRFQLEEFYDAINFL